mmetsp:Transcript_22317/g.28493  ORF Transcript_22317/g.28493 Transcript_22317/m.28493 type:complete len:115 (+) Transcript_22317:61-405(+)
MDCRCCSFRGNMRARIKPSVRMCIAMLCIFAICGLFLVILAVIELSSDGNLLTRDGYIAIGVGVSLAFVFGGILCAMQGFLFFAARKRAQAVEYDYADVKRETDTEPLLQQASV